MTAVDLRGNSPDLRHRTHAQCAFGILETANEAGISLGFPGGAIRMAELTLPILTDEFLCCLVYRAQPEQ